MESGSRSSHPSSPRNTKSGLRGMAPNYSTCLIFDKKGQDHLSSLTVAACNLDINHQTHTSHSHSFSLSSQKTSDRWNEDGLASASRGLFVPEGMVCNCCQAQFADREEQVDHYKCDWHRYNLHQKLRGKTSISEEEFEKIAEMSDVSSISGSDEDEDEDVRSQPPEIVEHERFAPSGRKLHKVFFRNHHHELISLHRCLLHHKKNPIAKADEMVAVAADLCKRTKWMIIMISAGHFASAIFHGKVLVEHKTFHRYTVRAKAGTAQSCRDKKGSAPKSAGARLRRYNEAALGQEITDLMHSWSDSIKNCDLIFVRIPVNNRAMFYGGKNPILKKEDQRIRVIPFPTRRPTLNEVKRIHQMLASVECFGLESEIGDMIPYSPPRVYVPETDELQIREPRMEKKTKPKSPKKDSEDPGRNLKSENLQTEMSVISDDPLEETPDMELVEELQILDLTHLREYEHTPKKKNKRKKGDGDKLASSNSDEDKHAQWQNKIFTASKTGNVDLLQSVIQEIQDATMISRHNISQVTSLSKILVNPSSTETKTVSIGTDPANCRTTDDDINLLCEPSERPSNLIESHPGLSNVHFVEEESAGSPSNNLQGICNKEMEKEDPSLEPNNNGLTDVLNKGFGDHCSTFLHVAAKHGHANIVSTLLEVGADPTVRDKFGQVPYSVSKSTEVRNSFRRFMGTYPDRFDYAKAQVPSPLTAEMEDEKKRKLAEKRKLKKKALNERNKEKKALEAKEREEKQEQERFLALSEREKRALAAERRLLHQSQQSGSRPVLSRCWQCGTDITGKVPFEYAEYKFCTTKCLREHRTKAS